jgi:hypothetical protein
VPAVAETASAIPNIGADIGNTLPSASATSNISLNIASSEPRPRVRTVPVITRQLLAADPQLTVTAAGDLADDVHLEEQRCQDKWAGQEMLRRLRLYHFGEEHAREVKTRRSALSLEELRLQTLRKFG